MNNTLEELKSQHFENYRNAIIENIKNNTNVLVKEDIMSLLKTPPLDSMDVIKTKFLDLAKKNKVILNTEKLSKIITDYRKDVVKVLDEVGEFRIETLTDKVSVTSIGSIIKFNKKDFIEINKNNKKIIKSKVQESIEKKIVKNVNLIFTDDVVEDKRNKIVTEALKFLKNNYLKQLLENIDFKVLVKDTILINGVKEQGERHLFTMENSRIFND